VFEVPKLARLLTRLILAGVMLMLVTAAALWWVTSREPRDFLGELEARNPGILNLDLSPDATRYQEDLRSTGSGIVAGKPNPASVQQGFRVTEGRSEEGVRDEVRSIAEAAGFEMGPYGSVSDNLLGRNEIGDSLEIFLGDGTVLVNLSDTSESVRATSR